MSFSRVNPGGWGVGAKFTSSQANQLDIDHANSLDKSGAGDTLSGFINVAPGAGGWGAGVGGAAGVSSGNGILLAWSAGQPLMVVGVSYGILAEQNSAIVGLVANSITAAATGAISTTVSGGISDGVAGGIQIGQTGGLVTTTPGGILLSGGASDYIQYASGHTRSISQGFAPATNGLPANWGLNGPTGLQNSADTGTGFATQMIVHHGATLSTVTMFLSVGASHAAVPTLPTFDVQRIPLTPEVGSLMNPQHLNSSVTLPFSPTPGTGAAWYNLLKVQSTVFTPNQNNVIDAANYAYYVVVVDETGGSSHFANTYWGFTSLFTNITSNAPG